MKYILGKDFDNILYKPTAVTVGNFDGLHLGHTKLIELVKECAERNDLLSVVLSFYPHPVSVLKGDKEFKMITSPEERYYILDQMGIDVFIEYIFDEEFSQMEPELFVRDILFKKLQAKYIIIGKNNRFGKEHRGTYNLLKALAEKNGVQVIGVDHVEDSGKKISSSGIRKLVFDKKFDIIERQMGRPYFVMGNVTHGRKVGRTLGFPTVNIIPNRHKVLPPNGAYITKTIFNDKSYLSITNIGNHPTFKDKAFTIETFLFDFDEEIYGKEVRVYFYKFLRDELKFETVEELKEQIKLDIENTQEYFNKLLSKPLVEKEESIENSFF